MPTFGGNAAQRAKQRADNPHLGGSDWIKTFREDRTDIRALFEDPKRTWHEYWQHYDKNLRISYPCAREVYLTCVGCRHEVENEEADTEEKKKDHGWTVRKASNRFVVPALNAKEYVDLYSVSKEFRDQVASIWEAAGSITAQDAVVQKIKDDEASSRYGEMRVKYSFTLVGQPGDRKYVRELRTLYAECAAGLASAPLSDEQQAANMRWMNGYLTLGIPNIGEILGNKYAFALEKYNSSIAQEEALYEQIKAQEDAGGGARGLLDRARQGPVTPTAAPISQPGAGAAPAAQPSAPAASAPDHTQIQELCRALTAHKVPYPADASLEMLQVMYDAFSPTWPAEAVPVAPEPTIIDTMAAALAEHNVPLPPNPTEEQVRTMYGAFSPTWATPAAAPVEPPAPAGPTDDQLKADLVAWNIAFPPDADRGILEMLHEAADPANPANRADQVAEAVAAAPAATPAAEYPTTAEGTPNFRAMDSDDIRAWLKAQFQATGDTKFQFDPDTARSGLLTIAERAAIGF